MKILFFTDPHLNVKKFNHLTPEGVPARASEFVQVFDWMKELCEERNIDRVVCGGDVFNSVHDLKMPFFNLAFFALDRLDVRVDLLDGNHDKYDAVYRPLDPFNKLGRVWAEPDSYWDNMLERNVVMLPFQRDLQEAKKVVKKLLKKKEDTIVFMHQGITGLFPDDLAYDPAMFAADHVDRIFAGHYHFPYDQDKIISPSSLFALNFGDSIDESRYVLIYDTKTGEVEKVENTLACGFLPLTNNQLADVKDEIEEIAPYTYLRLLLKPGEKLSLETSFLHTFRGYEITKEGKKKKKKEAKFQVDYSQEAPEDLDISDLRGSGDSNLAGDLTAEEFKELIIKFNKDKDLLDTAEAKADEVIEEAYLLGKV